MSTFMSLSLIIVLKIFGLNYVLNITLELKRVSMCQIKKGVKILFFSKMVQITKKKWEVLHNIDFSVAPNF